MKKDWKYLALFGAVLLGCGLSACSDDDDDEEKKDPVEFNNHLTGYITKDSVLKDLGLDVDYYIDGDLFVQNNAKLTIEPGVTIRFTDKRGTLTCEDNAAINMEGTLEKRIVFLGSTNSKGSWGSINYQSNRPENKMSFVTLKNGGSNAESGVLHISQDGSVSVKNCVIDGSLGNGVSSVFTDNAFTAFENDTIVNVAKTPMALQSFYNLKNIAANNVFKNNGANAIEFLGYASSIQKNVTFKNLGYDYYINSDVTVDDNGIMAVSDSVTLKFGNGIGIWVPGTGAIQISGTEEKPVVLTGIEDEAGYWRGIMFESEKQNQGGNFIKNCEFKNAGDKDGEDNSALYIHTLYANGTKVISLENVKFSNILNYALSVVWDGDNNEVDGLKMPATNVSFENCGKNVFVDLDGYLNMSAIDDAGLFFDDLESINVPTED